MNVLGLDTCFSALSVAVGVGLGSAAARVVARSEPMVTGHAERIMPLIGDLLGEAGLEIESINRIAVTVGPGSFTGTRIGIAAARAFHLAGGIAVVPVTSLEAIALSPQIGNVGPDEDLAIAIDAHRGEAYVQMFDGRTRDALGPPYIVAIADCAQFGRGRPLLITGTAAAALSDAVNAAGGEARAQPGMIFPDMARAVVGAVTRAPASQPVEPLYLRPPDAKPQEGKTLARARA